MTKEQKNISLIAELNQIRREQKTIASFKTVAEWLQYGKETCEKKSKIFEQLEKNNKQ